MVEIGIRELKSRLSYYVQLMQAGETIAVKVRERVVGFLSRLQPAISQTSRKRTSRQLVETLLEKWKRDGFLAKGGLYQHRKFRSVKMTPGITAAEMIRQMREEDL